jgi:hypothetical protein
MKTEILTSELLKLVDPTKDDVIYNNQKVKINFEDLKKYIENPKKHHVFAITGDFEKDLHKNLALYIINAGNESNLIHLDLGSPSIFESGKGLFEYIKNVYNNDEKSYIQLPENGDNLLLIKGNNLSPLSEELNIIDAEDMHYSTAASALSENPEKIKKTRGQVTWQQLNSDMYGDLNYVLEKVSEIFDVRRKSSDDNYDKLFKNLLDKINPEFAHSDEFKLALMDLNSHSLNEFFIKRYNENNPDIYSIDYSQPIFKEKLLEQVKNRHFDLLEQLFNSFGDYKRKYDNEDASKISKRLLNTIDFEYLFNQPETIDYLLNQNFTNDDIFRNASNQFTLASAYRFLDKDKRLNHDIAKKCIQLALKKHDNGYVSVNEDIIFGLESALFNEPFVLSSVIEHVDTAKVKRSLSYKGDFPILKDKQFLLSCAKNMSSWKLADWISTFYQDKDIDKEFVKNLAKVNKSFLDSINGQKYDKLNKYAYDNDITVAALEGGLSPSYISEKAMLPLLYLDHDPKIERIKLIFLIEKRAIDDFYYELRVTGDDLNKLKEKYHKPEFLFYQKDDYGSRSTEFKKKSLSEITTVQEVFEIFEKVKEHGFNNYKFLSGLFYESLPSHLKKEKSIVYKLLELGKLPYSKLDSSVAYNCDIALLCLTKNKEDIKDIPQELFTNAKFALGFAKLMDRNFFPHQDIPSFVTKFFENQGVKSKYEEHLKEHLFYTDLHTELDKPNVTTKAKKVKL